MVEQSMTVATTCEIQSMAARGRAHTYGIKHLIPLNTVLKVAVSLLIALGLILYISIFISPALLHKMLLAADLCKAGDEQSKAATIVSNVTFSTPKFSNAKDAAHNRDIDKEEEHSRLASEESTGLHTGGSKVLDARAISTICKECKGVAAGSGKSQENKEQPVKESEFLIQLSRDGRSIKVNCYSCQQQLIDADSYHDDDYSSTEVNPNMADDHITVRENSIVPRRFTVLVGVMTMASKMDRRNLLRLAYSVQSSPNAHISVRFVIGELERGLDKTLVGMENATYGDIIVLNCSENLNEGKTFAFFSSLAEKGLEYDYVMKADDDSYVRFENLGKSLQPLPRKDLYYGYILPCENDDPYTSYMAGMGYLISWDLVLWIKNSPIPRNKSVGTEDQLVGDWFNEGGVAKSRVSEKPLFYDHPEFGGECSHELIPETILVHQVKTTERWAHVLSFFEKDRISPALS